jgi:hypothetical protein
VLHFNNILSRSVTDGWAALCSGLVYEITLGWPRWAEICRKVALKRELVEDRVGYVTVDGKNMNIML